MMMKAIAIDDEPIALDVIRAHAEKVHYLELGAVFTDAFQAMEYLHRNPTDLLFLDIKMPDISGIELLNSLSKKPMVIFTTAYSEHAVESFELNAVDYLLKPFSLARFIKACNKAHELYQLRQDRKPVDYLFVKTGYEQIRVLFDDILYLEAAGNYVTFVLRDRQLLCRSTINDAMDWLPKNNFARVHRSFIVSKNKIDRIERSQVTIGKKIIPVSEAYRQFLTDERN